MCGCLCVHLVTPAYNNGDGICLVIQDDPGYPDVASTNWLLVKICLGGDNCFQTENEHIDTGLCNAAQPASAEHLCMFTTPAVAGLPPCWRGLSW